MITIKQIEEKGEALKIFLQKIKILWGHHRAYRKLLREAAKNFKKDQQK